MFTLCNDEALRRNFINNLLYATEVAGGRTVVVTTLRADFYHRAAVMPSLADHLSEHQVLVTPMGAEELVEAIEGPARKVGLVFDDGLVEILRNDVLGQPGGLPLLEYALKELWEQREANRLTLQAYHRIGGVQGAIAARAEAEFEQLSESQQRAARRVLMRLVRPGEGTEDTRRRARLNELGDPDDPTLSHVVQTLAGARLLITGRDEGDGTEQLEVAHEALIRNWPRLRTMLDENREALRTQRRLTEQALEWDQNGRGADWLLRGVALEEAGRLAAEADSDSTVLLNPVELAFVAASQRLRNREEKRRRLFSTSLTVLLVISVATSITGWRFWQQAEEQRRVAEEQRLLAEEREQDANRERARANAERRAAEEQRQLAELRQHEAERQQRIAYARQLAAQARFFKERDPVLSLLLGVQATHAAGDQGRRYAPSTEEALRETLATPIGPLLRDQDHEATSVVVSPDGRWIAAGGQSGDIHLWRVRREIELAHILQGHDESIRVLAISGSSDGLFSGSQDGILRRWELDTPDSPRSTLLPHHPAGIWSLVVGSGDRWLAVGLADGTIHIHSLAGDHVEYPVIRGHEGSVNALTVSPDSQWLISGGEDGAIRLWPIAQLEDPEIQARELPGHQDSVFALTMHPDGHWLASGGRDGTIMVWSLEADDIPPRALRGHGGAVNAVVASTDGQWLASASDDRTIRIWQIDDDAVTAPLVLRGHDGGIWSLAGDPRGQWLSSAAADGQVRIWRVGEEVAMPIVLRRHEGWVWAVTSSPDGHWMASAGRDGIVRLWPNAGDVLGEPQLLRGHQNWVWSLAIDPDSRWLASADEAGIIRFWPLGDSDVEPRTLQGHRGRIYSVAADPRGRWLASGGADATVRLWSLTAPESTHQILSDNTDEVLDVSFSPDGQWLASGGADATVRIWQLDDLSRAASVLRGHEGRVSSVDFSPDGRWLASAGEDGTIQIWSLDDTSRPPRILRGHEGRVLSLSYSPDGKSLASGGSDGTVRIWPTDQAHTVPQVLRGHSGRVWTVDYAASGLWLGSGGADGTVRLWQIDLDNVVDTACSFAGRNLTWDEWQRLMDQPDYRRTCEQLPIHESVYQPLLEAAGELARTGDLDQVLALLRTARERAPGLELDPESKAQELLRNVDGTP